MKMRNLFKSLKILKNKDGGILIWTISISSFVFLVFFSLSILTRRNIQVMYENIESISAFFSAEGAAEEGIIRAITENDLNKILNKDLVEGTVTNYKNKIKGLLDRNTTTEYWLSDEQDNESNDIEKIKKLKISWNFNGTDKESFGLVENSDLSILIGKWPKNNPYNLTTGYIYYKEDDSLLENSSFEASSSDNFDYWEENGDVSSTADSKIDDEAVELGTNGYISQIAYNLLAGQDYFLEFYAKGKTGGTEDLEVYVCKNDGDPYSGTPSCVEYLHELYSDISNKYQKIETSFSAEDIDATFYIKSTSGNVIIDGVEVSLKPDSPQYRESRLIKDGGNDFDLDGSNYVIFLKTGQNSTHYEIKALDATGQEISFPDKVLEAEVTVNSGKADLRRTIKIKKSLYSDGNSDFPYTENYLY